ncbi:MAG: hypothetical protein JHD16_09805 [Solirubrobacteraceae bacterium]|nr:hypothetical protein [Solirubrobacteraceae bacterium]
MASLTGAMFAGPVMAAPSTSLLKQINRATMDGAGGGDDGYGNSALGTAAGRAYFNGTDGTNSAGPWRLTENGATALGDPTTWDGTTASGWTTIGDLTYFTTYNGLWVTDGTAAGTHRIEGTDGNVGNLTAAGGSLYFSAGGYSRAYKLTPPSETVTLAGLDGDKDQLYVEDFLTLPSGLVLTSTYDFSANSDPRRLVSGTGASSHILEFEGEPLAISLGSYYVTVVGDLAYFVAETADGPRVFSTDGTDAGTHLVSDVEPPLYTQFVPAGGNRALFVADGTIYSTTGTSATAVGQAPDDENWNSPVYLDGKLYYGASDGDGNSLWSHALGGANDTATRLRAGRVESIVSSSGAVYARMIDGRDRAVIVRTDGTADGTTALTDPATLSEIYSMVARPGGGLLVDGRGPEVGREIHVVTGTPGQAPAAAVDLNRKPAGTRFGSSRDHVAQFGNQTLFFAGDGAQSPQPWVTDGTTSGTRALWPGYRFSDPSEVVATQSRAAFTTEGGEGAELWATDGTSTEPKLISAQYPAAGNDPSKLTATASAFYYLAASATDDWRKGIFTSDGTGAGTLVPLPAGAPSGADVKSLKAVGTTLYFSLVDPSSDSETTQLWAMDTKTGTSTLLSTAPASYRLDRGVVAGGQFYLPLVNTDDNENQIWVTDGTVEGTHDLNVEPGRRGSKAPATLVTDGTVVYATTPASQPVSVGSVGGSIAEYSSSLHLSRITGRTVERMTEGEDIPLEAFTEYATVLGGALYATSGSQLLKIASTATSPTVVKQFPGEIGWVTAVGGALYFGATDDDHGTEPWVSDGTEAGTKLLSDVNEGAASSQPTVFFRAGTQVAFGATTSALGAQLYAYGEPPAPQAPSTTPETPSTPETPAKPETPGTPAASTPSPSAPPTGSPAPATDSRAPVARVSSAAKPADSSPKAYAFEIQGSVVAIKGMRKREECRGQVEILVTATTKQGTGPTAQTIVKELSTTKVRVKWADGKCVYRKTIKVKKKQLPAGAKLEATVTFIGSRNQLPKTGEPIELKID